MSYKVLDLFSGVGGFALAFDAAGFETMAFSEIEPYPCKILTKHWPSVPNLGDIRGINGEDFRGTVDVVCGGFPCQDISTAGKGAGLEGGRSRLWFEMLRVIRGSRPAFCLIENVPALRTRGADEVIEGLEEIGYTARPFVVGAINAGAPHRRQRVWIVAYTKGTRERREIGDICKTDGGSGGSLLRESFGSSKNISNSESIRRSSRRAEPTEQRWDTQPDKNSKYASNSNHQRLAVRDGSEATAWSRTTITRGDWWATEPALGRVANGIPDRAHRIKALGNSVVPHVVYPFAVWIMNQLTNKEPING